MQMKDNFTSITYS